MNMDEEIICDFKVTKERKKIWAYQLDMLKKFHDVCVENNLKYFLCGGSLIGAIRHNGYIPWDDDIDVGMLRDDYEKFLKLFDKYFDKNTYFLSSAKTERLYANGHSQIRNIHTTQFTKYDYPSLKAGKCCGIFMDIFVFDYCDINDVEQFNEIRRLKSKTFKFLSWRFGKDNNPIKEIVKKVLANTIKNENKNQQRVYDLEKVSSKYNNDETKLYLGSIGFSIDNKKCIYKKELFNEFELHKFEEYEFYIPVHYDEILKNQYGDYMKFPDNKNINGSMHGDCYFDFDKSYKEYQNITLEEFENLITNKIVY